MYHFGLFCFSFFNAIEITDEGERFIPIRISKKENKKDVRIDGKEK